MFSNEMERRDGMDRAAGRPSGLLFADFSNELNLTATHSGINLVTVGKKD